MIFNLWESLFRWDDKCNIYVIIDNNNNNKTQEDNREILKFSLKIETNSSIVSFHHWICCLKINHLSLKNYLWHTKVEKRTSSMILCLQMVPSVFLFLSLSPPQASVFMMPLFRQYGYFFLLALVLFLIALQILVARSTTHFIFATGTTRKRVRRKVCFQENFTTTDD